MWCEEARGIAKTTPRSCRPGWVDRAPSQQERKKTEKTEGLYNKQKAQLHCFFVHSKQN